MKENESTRDLLAYFADYWVTRELRFVETPEQLRESLNNFNREAPQFRDFALKRVRVHFDYWVYDPLSETFGPNKFVGFQDMTFSKYQRAHEIRIIELDHSRFNGGRTRRAIRKALRADFEADRELWGALEKWAESLFRVPSVFKGRDHSVWKFVRLG
jgi:hypothetical protein